jgi:diguanylate cyclase (GGDEF)-like protein
MLMVQIAALLYLFLAVLVALSFAIYLLNRGRTGVTISFALLNLCIAVYLLGYMVELSVDSLSEMLFWNQVQYLGIPFLPFFWLLVCLLYTNKLNKISFKPILILFLFPVIVFLVRLTNESHRLFYTAYEVISFGSLNLLRLTKGPVYYMHTLFAALCLIAATAIYLRAAGKVEGREKQGYKLMLISSMIPYAALLLMIFDPTNRGIDYAAFLFPVSLCLIFFALLQYDVLSIKAFAKDNLFYQSQDAMLIIEKEGLLLDYNWQAQALFLPLANGFKVKEKQIQQTLKGYPQLIEVIKAGVSTDIILDVRNSKRHYEVSCTVLTNLHRRVVGKLVTLRDITDRKIIEEALRESEEKHRVLATTDTLTGLHNRFYFMKRAEDEFNRFQRYGKPFSIIMIDLDCFKEVNDKYGHAGGDKVLKQIGLLMQGNFRKTDITGRLGGEEFCVLMPETTPEDAWKAAEAFRQTLEAAIIINEGRSIAVTCSIGISSSSKDSHSLYEVLKQADQALYRAKNQGRNCSCINKKI